MQVSNNNPSVLSELFGDFASDFSQESSASGVEEFGGVPVSKLMNIDTLCQDTALDFAQEVKKLADSSQFSKSEAQYYYYLYQLLLLRAVPVLPF